MPLQIQRIEVELQDLYVSLDEATELQDSTLFEVRELQWRPWEQEKKFVMAVTMEMDLDLKFIQRNHFTAFDLLSDIGGFASIIQFFIVLFLTAWN